MNLIDALLLAYSKLMVRFLMIAYLVIAASHLSAQTHPTSLYKVMTLAGQKQGARDIPQDHGLNGIWQKLLKLRTTASVMHTQAHPDDEHADLLTYLSRGIGVRTSLLSLNRGEAGGNILGVEAFDQLGLVRTEEFLLAGSYYGLDDLYFTALADYGFSKRVEEAYEKWGKQNVLCEMVRVIRINRPLVVISRFHGTARDGHGNHQAAGEMSLEAYRLAADPSAFPEQITKEGLRPWKALKYYRGGVKVSEHWNIALNTGEYCVWIGDSYRNFASLGYSLHRSQHGGQRNRVNGSFFQYYERIDSKVKSDEKENNFFNGLDTSITGIFKLTGEPIPAGVPILLEKIQSSVNSAVDAFQVERPEAMIPYLTKGLADTRAVIKLLPNQPDGAFMLLIKEKQFTDAINSVLGIQTRAIAMPLGKKESLSVWQPPPTMGLVVPGQSFNIHVGVLNAGKTPIQVSNVKLISQPNWTIQSPPVQTSVLQNNEKTDHVFTAVVPNDPVFTQPYYHRASLQESKYSYINNGDANLPNSPVALQASVTYLVNKEPVEMVVPVQVSQSNVPYGYNMYTLKVAPGIAVNVAPGNGIVSRNGSQRPIEIGVELVNNFDHPVTGELQLKIPEGWKSESKNIPFRFTKAHEKINVSIKVQPGVPGENIYEIKALAIVDGITYSQGYDMSSHRDLEQSILYRPAITYLKGIDVKLAPAVRIGYVMGVGDEIPAALKQLGASVQLLSAADLATGALEQYSTIVIGTRAYAVREDLITYNGRLLEFARKGGHLIVLFQTPEYNPAVMAPYPAQLPASPEEVSEENSPIKILAPAHRVLNYPNKITSGDFDNWVEQRGSKFFSQWNQVYSPIISTQDVGQSPQSGGWLMAACGKGHYTYFAYSFHRQLPYGVTGAFRIMANLISYNRK